MIAVILAGASLGLGLGAVARGLRGGPPLLADVLATLERSSRIAVSRPAAPWSRLVSAAAGGGSPRRRRDLAVLERTAERHAVERLASAVALGVLPLLASAVMRAGGVSGALGPTLVLAVVGVGIGYWLPEVTLRSQAAARRDEVVTALSGYLDLVAILLAGGTGTETALIAAADAGDSWTFQRLRDALTVARARRRSPWDGLAELGRELGVDELVELASSVQLAGEQGARVTVSLAARASALRAAQLARVEARAQSATERMSLPTVLLFLGFLVLLGYPALQIVLEGFG